MVQNTIALMLLCAISFSHGMEQEKIEFIEEELTNQPSILVSERQTLDTTTIKRVLEFLSYCHADGSNKVRPDYATFPSYNCGEKLHKYPHLVSFIKAGLQEDLRTNNNALKNIYAEIIKKSEFIAIYNIKNTPSEYKPLFNEQYFKDQEYKVRTDLHFFSALAKFFAVKNEKLLERIFLQRAPLNYSYCYLLHEANTDIDKNKEKCSSEYEVNIAHMFLCLRSLDGDYRAFERNKELEKYNKSTGCWDFLWCCT